MKIAVITGAASGIGLALSLVCLKRGMTVVMTDKDSQKLESESHSLCRQFPQQVLHYCCDVTKPEEIQGLLNVIDKQLGQVDWIFNNAGIIGPLAPIWETSQEHLENIMNVNLYGMIHMIRIFMPYLFEQKHQSHLINMASLYGICSGSQLAGYSMSKHAVLALSESLYFDLKRLNKPVHISIVFPSFTDTSLLSNPNEPSAFHESLNSLLSHSRPANDVAISIIEAVEQQQFYIFPDKEVKGYCEERTHSILNQELPHLNNIEKLMNSLMNRKSLNP